MHIHEAGSSRSGPELATEQRRVAARRELGQQLRALRELSGLSGQRVAQALGWSQAKVSRIEKARTRAEAADIAKLLDVLNVEPGRRDALLLLAELAAGPPETWRNSSRTGLTRRQQDFVAFEAAATRIRHYQPLLIPGYLQTTEYARRVLAMADANDLERRLESRLARRQIVIGDSAPSYEIVLLDSALRWRPGPATVMAEQLDLLRKMVRRPNVTVRVVPLDREQNSFVQHPFVLYDFGEASPTEGLVETTTTDLRITDEDEVEALGRFFGRLSSSALSQRDSLSLIRQKHQSYMDLSKTEEGT
ncbi:MAG: hypothetical protein QOF58_6654 [Pseudonocardiales bacterium]|nr:hypothetical protein [Actinomycetota bacterium]MDT7788235.1 hypothetical protein [Pseudonocardiales bacterium]